MPKWLNVVVCGHPKFQVRFKPGRELAPGDTVNPSFLKRRTYLHQATLKTDHLKVILALPGLTAGSDKSLSHLKTRWWCLAALMGIITMASVTKAASNVCCTAPIISAPCTMRCGQRELTLRYVWMKCYYCCRHTHSSVFVPHISWAAITSAVAWNLGT